MQIASDTCAIVTGGASGLGEGSARALASAGAQVVIFDLNNERGEALAAELDGLFCKVDITKQNEVIDGFARARAAFGQERILINCAGGGKAARTISRNRDTGEYVPHDIELFERIVSLNLVGTFRCISVAAAGMASLPLAADGERGVIVNTASVAAQEGQVGQVSYAAAKAGIVGMTLNIARDLSGEEIRINTIMPGIMATPPMLGVREDIREGLAASVPFPKRLGRPDEFGSLVLELVRNTYLNGQAIRLDGAIKMAPR